MLLRLQWKDPDFSVRVVVEKMCRDRYELPEEVQDRLHELGIGEYLQIEVDTTTGESRIIP